MDLDRETGGGAPAAEWPSAPLQGQVFIDGEGGFWQVTRLTFAQTPAGFYIVHVSYGASLDRMHESMVLGPREFAALVRERHLHSHLHSV